MHFFFSPSGRIGRAQWWFGWLLPLAIAAAALTIARLLMGEDAMSVAPTNEFLAILIVSTFLAISLWINFCLTAKRYHDRGKQAFWFFILFVPVIGPVWQVIECGFLPGSEDGKRHGTRTRPAWLAGGRETAALQHA